MSILGLDFCIFYSYQQAVIFIQINRHELDLASERLSTELKRLDRHVSTAVVDHVTTVFADAELPVHNMIQAATASLLVHKLIVYL